jgi:hypothetical protein
MNEQRHSTAIHEAGHTVIAYAVGKIIMHVVLFNDESGETMPQCGGCETCAGYYLENPISDPHSRVIQDVIRRDILVPIQDDIRRDIATAMAGEAAEFAVYEKQYLNSDDLGPDRRKARGGIAMLHYHLNPKCYENILRNVYPPTCKTCDNNMGIFKQSIKEMIAKPEITMCVMALAEHLHTLNDGMRMYKEEICAFLQSKGLAFGSMFDLLPPAPSANEGIVR